MSALFPVELNLDVWKEKRRKRKRKRKKGLWTCLFCKIVFFVGFSLFMGC